METDRLILREFEQGDVDSVQDYAVDPEVCKYMLWGPNTLADTTAFVQSILDQQLKQPRTDWSFALTMKGSEGRLVGECRMHVVHPANKEGEIGYVLNRMYWNQGYMTEAVRRVIDSGFEELGLHRIVGICHPANRASVRVMEKTGMEREGHLREHLRWKGHWRDSLLYSVIESDRRLLNRSD